MTETNLHIRNLLVSDAETLFGWRNHPVTRKNSKNQEPLIWEEHLAWIKALCANKSAHAFMVEDADGAPVAHVRYTSMDSAENLYLVSIMVELERRGANIGTRSLLDTFSLLATLAPGPTVRAEIKSDNIASLRAFQKAGYLEVSDQGGLSVLEKT